MKSHSNHSLFSPSSSSRWSECTGSLALLQQYPQPFQTSPALQWGLRVHYFAELLLKEKVSYDELLAIHTDEEELITEAYHFSQYVVNYSQEGTVYIENKVRMDSIHPDLFGKPDVVIITPSHLHIIDLKTGREHISAIYNTQLLLYAQGALDTYRLHNISSITLHIFQYNARAGNNVNKHIISISHLTQFSNRIRRLLNQYKQGIHTFATGEHCKYCPVKDYCNHYTQYNASHLDYLQSRQNKRLEDITTEEAVHMYSIYKDLTPFIESIQAKLLDTPQDLLQASNMTIKTRRSSQSYTDENKALQVLQDAGASIDEVAPRALISPSKLKKLNSFYHDAVQDYLTPVTDIKYLHNLKN